MAFKAPDSLAEQIAQHLGDRIISGELKAGDRIQELRIANELNVSRGSVREAFLILDRRFLLDIVPRKGAMVSQMSATQVKEVYEAVAIMLAVVAGKVAERWRGDEMQVFVGIFERMKQFCAQGNAKEHLEATFDFYQAAYDFLDNAFLENIMEDILPAIKRAYNQAINVEQAELDESLAFFEGLLGAVLERDKDRAQGIISEFAEHQSNIILNNLD